MIDWGRVEELRTEVGEDDFAEVVLLFLEEADEVASRLETTVPSSAQIARDLHSLKGAALNLGFADLAECCADGERRARDGEDGVDLPAIARCYHDSKAAFQLALSQSAA